jgi:hypothetical protein
MHNYIHFTGLVSFREPNCSQRDILSDGYGPGSFVYHSDFLVRGVFENTSQLTNSDRRRVFEHHPEVQFKPGPFYMGPGLLGWTFNVLCITW